MKLQKKSKAQAFIMAIMIMFTVFTIIFLKTDININHRNIEYIKSFGWEVDNKPVDTMSISLPSSSDSIFSAYCKTMEPLFDLSQFSGKRVLRYSYKVKNHIESSSNMIRINILIYEENIISADISSLMENGFILPIDNTSGIIQ